MKKHLLALLLATGILSACQDSEDPETIIIRTDSQTLSERISLDGTGVVALIDPNAPSGRIMESSSDLPLILISQVPGPVYDGQTLRATHVDIEGDYAYVGYNLEGDRYLGAVEIFNISDAYKPVIVSQAIFTDAEVSSLEFANGTLYLAMAVDIDGSQEVSSPANLASVSVSGGNFTSGFSFTSIEGFVATDVTRTQNSTAITSGNPGILGLADNAGNITNQMEMEDLRSVAFGNDRLAVLSGVNGATILNPSNLSTTATISLPAATPEAKRTIAINNNRVYIAEGANGAGIYRLDNGAELAKLPIPINPADTDPGDVVTNAVSVDNSLLFMANGAAGVSISDVTSTDDIKSYGIIDLDGSSNFVRNEENFVFVATGTGGLQILKINEKESDPTETACASLPAYPGDYWLNINSNETKAYGGAASIGGVNNNSNFLFCGSLAILEQFNLNGNSVTEVYGALAFGRYNGGTTMNVNSTLKLSGSIVIYGDLNLNSGAKLEFVGTGNSITIYGRVNKNSGVTITGDYTDTEGKLK
ncbi:hypothetical protein [Algoriphagus terrigena]|uniref:hypothetical protein n=1 Tax=Algoriphagus terrigena TaxID=344884 RepID=UPI000416A085|nr:hypothetical protein [Algoriphagus terrigena]